jgi:hypothetical protein
VAIGAIEARSAKEARLQLPAVRSEPDRTYARAASAPWVHVGRRHRRWIVTLLATAASTYALDGFAIAVGAVLAASGLVAGLDGPLLFAFLAATYAVWGVGLRAGLAANWSLLNCTGTSTNALSKAAHDIARARHASPRIRRFAASSGYILTELAKEVPYYAGASGAALLSNSVSAGDAIVFLGGTNLGAALYEYVLARATRAYLRRRTGGE